MLLSQRYWSNFNFSRSKLHNGVLSTANTAGITAGRCTTMPESNACRAGAVLAAVGFEHLVHESQRHTRSMA